MSDRTLRCWGQNEYGQLGNGVTGVSLFPVVVAGIVDAVQVVAGSYHTCAMLADGTLACWGNNEAGQLGNGTLGASSFSALPTRVQGL